MEFNFRAGDHRPPPPPPPPPAMQLLPPRPPPMQFLPPGPPPAYCLSEQGFSDFFMDSTESFRQTTNIVTLRQPFVPNEERHWEMELMRLREEKLMGEIERERFLKEEARRELRLFEREIAIRGLTPSAVGYPFQQPQQWVGPPSSAVAAPCPSPLPAVPVHAYHEWHRMEQVKTSGRLGFGAVSLRPRIQPLMVEDKKEPKVTKEAASERELIEKPVRNALREKRKAETTSPSTKVIKLSLVKKTSQAEWSCALCKVSTANEIGFNEHLRGKKHMRKEASLRARKESKVSQAAAEPLPKKRRKPWQAMAAAAGGGAEGKEKETTKDGETHVGEKTEGSVDMNALIPYFPKVGDKEENKQENNSTVLGSDDDVMAKNVTFWCEEGKVGASQTKVMLAHVNGKKHQAKLKEANQTEEEGRPL
ncbi:uncharacterized protein LOC103493667 isoform X2 [Cucumis melo]|uniref:Uncharacterized protein LOC103493667 isoform X2 n=1 Tax=Cucumis melo TaxID=3656 RepID=A0A1S3BUI4_CUCME|nr:uncharacterized protein LOC103493667 isoform X2 [Cucumis melo]